MKKKEPIHYGWAIACVMALVIFTILLSPSKENITGQPIIDMRDAGMQVLCTDSDGGKNYYEQGTARSGPWFYTDYCPGLYESSLREFFCHNGAISSEVVNCASLGDYTCSEGACEENTRTPTRMQPIDAQPLSYRVFVSNATHDGNLGGLTGADALCTYYAWHAALGGNWKAWLSDNNQSAADRLYHSPLPYRLLPPNNSIIALNWADLTDGVLRNNIGLSEVGEYVYPNLGVWTGTGHDGSAQSYNCYEWTNGTQPSLGLEGRVSFVDFRWTNYSLAGCGIQKHIYCIEQP